MKLREILALLYRSDDISRNIVIQEYKENSAGRVLYKGTIDDLIYYFDYGDTCKIIRLPKHEFCKYRVVEITVNSNIAAEKNLPDILRSRIIKVA